MYTNFSGPSEHSEQCMQQHDCCHALACTPPGHHGLSRTVFSVCRHDSLFRQACVAATGNYNLDDVSHTVAHSVATAGMASVMSVSSKWPACCILDLSFLLGTGRGTATICFCVLFSASGMSSHRHQWSYVLRLCELR